MERILTINKEIKLILASWNGISTKYYFSNSSTEDKRKFIKNNFPIIFNKYNNNGKGPFKNNIDIFYFGSIKDINNGSALGTRLLKLKLNEENTEYILNNGKMNNKGYENIYTEEENDFKIKIMTSRKNLNCTIFIFDIEEINKSSDINLKLKIQNL